MTTPAAEAIPYEPPAMTRSEIELANLRARRRAPLVLPSGVGPLSVAVAPAGEDDWAGRWARVDAEVGGRPAQAWLPFEVVEGVARGSYPDLDVEALGPAERALVCEALEGDLLAALSPGGFSTVTLRSIEIGPPPPSEALRLSVTSSGGGTIPAAVRLHPVERERLRKALARLAPLREPFPGLTLPIAFRCGYARVPLAEFATLEVGCGVLLDDTTLGFQKIMAVSAERFAQTCAWQTIKPVLDGSLLRPAGAAAAGYLASPFVTDKSDQEPAGASVDEVPIHLVFELGRLEIPVSDLESLGAGYVFDLNRPLGQNVDILANGRRIGAGELVRIGDGIGVRVSRLVR